MQIILALLALTGCAAAERRPDAARQAQEAPFRAPGVVETGLGGIARLGDVEVRPLAILEDSRCPGDVACIWAGRVRVKVTISGVPGEPEMEIGEPVALPGGGAILLTAVAPHPSHRSPSPAPARFAFIRRD